MKGYLFDPAFFTSFVDVDLGFRLNAANIEIMEYPTQIENTYDPIETNKGYKKSIKNKWLRCDGIIWRNKYKNNPCILEHSPLYPESSLSDPEIIAIAEKRIK